MTLDRAVLLVKLKLKIGELFLLTKDKSFYKNLLFLAIPISMQNLITFAVNFADNLMIGKLGDNAISGVYMGNQIQTFLQLFVEGIGAACLVIATQYWGKKDRESIKTIIAIGTKISIFIGFVFMLVSLTIPKSIISLLTDKTLVIENGSTYLLYISIGFLFFSVSQILIISMRCIEKAKIGMYISFLTLIINVFLNYLLIFGKFGFPELGIMGAAIATTISRFFELIFIIVYYKKDQILNFKMCDLLRKNKILLLDFFKFGFPIISGGMVWAINTFLQSAIMGRYPTEVISAFSMTNMLNSLVYVWILGLSGAVGIITGKTVGAGKRGIMIEYAKTVQILFFGVGIVTGIFVALLKNPFISMYNISGETIAQAKQMMTVLSITIVGTCYQATTLGGLVKAGGDTSFVFKNDTIFVFLFVLPSAFISMKLGMPGWFVFTCLKCDQILKCFVAVVKINKFNWMKKLTREF